MENKAKIAVIGSYAVGATIRCRQFPAAGQTVPGHGFEMMHGGKGSNQAVAAHRMGAEVLYATCIGDDSFGQMCLDLYRQEGISTEYIRKSTERTATGAGLVYVNENGENEIVIGLGANNEFSPADIDRIFPEIEKCKILLMQLEMPVETVLHAAKRCKEAGVSFVLNPAPFRELPEEIFQYCDYVTPNQTEARQMLGISLSDNISDEEVGRQLRNHGIKNVVMTLGEGGVLLVTESGNRVVPGIHVAAVDTTGAGDTFSGAFCVAVAEGQDPDKAAEFGNIAAGLAVARYGVVDAIPYRKEVDSYRKENK